MIKILLMIVVLNECKSENHENNVCSKLSDYVIIQLSKNCWYNPDVGSTSEEIIKRYGFPFESHQVITEDGYKLGLFRLPNKGQPILLQHGLGCTSLAYLALGNNSLAFKLYDFGYDIWLGNFRGTIYSNGHIRDNISDSQYWDFSFYEMGFYDLPAMVEYISHKNPKKIIYVGHSMGTTSSFVYSITKPSHAKDHIAALISLAPVAYMKYVWLPIANLALINGPIQTLANIFNIYKFGMFNSSEQTERYENCLFSSWKKLQCEVMSEIIVALNLDSVAPEALPLYLSQVPSGTSLKTIRHYSQEIVSGGHFQFYDYENLNKKKYKSEKPPVFDVGKINVPVYLFYGKKDAVADEKDVFMFYQGLKTKKFIKKIPEKEDVEFKHLDFLFGKDIHYLYDPLFTIITNITSE